MEMGKSRDKPGRPDWQRWAGLCVRISLGAAFLSGIADRFGLYRGRNVGYGDFAGFVRYTAKVNSFMPPSTIPFLAWAATIAELFFGIALILGIWRVWVWCTSREWALIVPQVKYFRKTLWPFSLNQNWRTTRQHA